MFTVLLVMMSVGSEFKRHRRRLDFTYFYHFKVAETQMVAKNFEPKTG